MTVRALDGRGNPLAATTIGEGDSLAHAVKFQGRSLGSLAPDGFTRLQFVVEPPGKLYSFTVR